MTNFSAQRAFISAANVMEDEQDADSDCEGWPATTTVRRAFKPALIEFLVFAKVDPSMSGIMPLAAWNDLITAVEGVNIYAD